MYIYIFLLKRIFCYVVPLTNESREYALLVCDMKTLSYSGESEGERHVLHRFRRYIRLYTEDTN